MDTSSDSNLKNLNTSSELSNTDNVSKGAHNIQAITLYVYSKIFLLDPSSEMNIPRRLIIERYTGRITEMNLNEKIPENYERKKAYSGFLGILNVFAKAFLLMIDDAISICSIEGSEIYSIGSTSFIQLIPEPEIFLGQTGKDISNHLQNIRKLLSKGHYFSYGYNLSLTRIKNTLNKLTDMKFIWNSYLVQELIKFNIDKTWILPLIQGYVGVLESYLQGKKLELFLISRRSCHKAGTRYNARGIDDNGNVANYCETEQIIYYNNYCCSYVQLRGSVPLFWQQRGTLAQAKITRSYDLTNSAFLKHFEEMNNSYGKVLCLNLLAKSKPPEQLITEQFEQHIIKNNLDYVRYEYFDFHGACKGQKFNKLNPIIMKLMPIIENFRFYAEDRLKKVILLTQKGIIRTNCLDCLDRTNVFQTKIAITVFDMQMQHLGVDLKSSFGQHVLLQLDNDNLKQQHPFIIQYKNLWADNGDIISMHYAGTGSVISGVTRTGKRNFLGLIDHGMKSLNRFYIGNFEDQEKQETIDILLGQHTETVNVLGEQFEMAIKAREEEFSTFNDISIFLVTWNIGGFEPALQYDLTPLLDWEGHKTPDIIVIGFQEYIPLSAKNLMTNGSGNENLLNSWKSIIANHLKKYDKYFFVHQQSLVGILTLIFAKEGIRDQINRVDADVVKTGLAGKLGNKGGVVIKMYIDDSSFSFTNVHLEAGASANNSRLMNLINIHNKAFQEEGIGKRREEPIINLEYKFLMGDTNFRVNLPNVEVRGMIDNYLALMNNDKIHQASQALNEILKHDQLKNSKESNDILEKYQEGLIRFLPTYKYDMHSNAYDTSKKQRTPSWTDRILWSCENENNIKQLFYVRKEIKDSDHRPVLSMFIVRIRKVNEAKKEEIIKQIYESVVNLRKSTEEDELDNTKEHNIVPDEEANNTYNNFIFDEPLSMSRYI